MRLLPDAARRLIGGGLELALLLSLSVVPVAAEDDVAVPEPRPAHEVVERGRVSLADALVLACAPAWTRRTTSRPVVLIVDPSPSAAAREEAFVDALIELDARAGGSVRWRLATLGRAPSKAAASAAELGPSLAAAIAARDVPLDTVSALRATAELSPAGAVLVYVAAERFEDEREVETAARALVSRGQTFAAVGPEAGFHRAWNDGLFPPYRGRRDASGERVYYDPSVGRDAFDADPDGPAWHGGEVAFPMLPMHFGMHWDGRLFTTREEIDPETGETQRVSVGSAYPSGWGPWALSRLAAVTGGRYVTWSPRTSAEPTVYDGSKLDQLAPDLRSRAAVLQAAAKRPLRAETIRVWGEMTDATSAIFRVTPPVRGDLGTPLRVAEPRPTGRPSTILYERSDHAQFVREVPGLLRLLSDAIRRMDRAIERADEPRTDAARRDLADARLLRHVLLCERFAWGEAQARGRRLMPRPWRDDGMVPALHDVDLAERNGSGDQVVHTEIEVADRRLADRVLADRAFLIEAYAGTPWGEMVARNRVSTYELVRTRLASGNPERRDGPPDTAPRTPPTTPSGPSTGPATGE